MPTFKKPDPNPLEPRTFVELLGQDGWRLTSGFGVLEKDAGARVIRAFIEDNLLIIEAERKDGSGISIFQLGIRDRLLYGAYPYLLQVLRPQEQECDRPKVLGGGRQKKDLMRVYIGIRNQGLHDKEEEVIRVARESSREAQVAAERQFVGSLGVVGRRLVDITPDAGGRGTLLHFADGAKLYVPTRLQNLRPASPLSVPR